MPIFLEAEEKHGCSPIAVHAKVHTCHTFGSIHLPSPSFARLQKPRFGIIDILAFHPSLAAVPILLDMERFPSIPYLGSGVFDYSCASRGCYRLSRGEGQFSEPCSLICKVCAAELNGTVGGKIRKAFSVSWPSKKSSPVARQIGTGPRTGNRHSHASCLLTCSIT